MPFSFSLVFFLLSSFFLSLLSFSVFLFLFRFLFSSCRFSVGFLYRLLRFSFRFPAFLDGGFCYSVISSRCYTPPRAACEPEVCVFPLRAVFFLALLRLIYFIFLFFLPFFLFRFWTSFVSSCLFLVGTMLSPRFRFLLRLV